MATIKIIIDQKKCIFRSRIQVPHKIARLWIQWDLLQQGPLQVKCWHLNYDIFLNEFPAYFKKCGKINSDISQNMLEINSEIYNNLVDLDDLSWNQQRSLVTTSLRKNWRAWKSSLYIWNIKNFSDCFGK